MRLFKGVEQEPEAPPPQEEPSQLPREAGPAILTEGPLLAPWFVLYRLEEEMERARRYGRPLSILIISAPALLSREKLDPEAISAAVEAARVTARSTDLLGWVDDGTLLIVMPETPEREAQVAVSRWQNEMWLRSRKFGGGKWEVAAVQGSEDLESADQFIQAVRERQAQKEAS